MPIKRSAILLMVLTAGAVSLLVFSSHRPVPAVALPIKCTTLECSEPYDRGVFSPWDLLPRLVMRPVV